jgi:hypothetical protein
MGSGKFMGDGGALGFSSLDELMQAQDLSPMRKVEFTILPLLWKVEVKQPVQILISKPNGQSPLTK